MSSALGLLALFACTSSDTAEPPGTDTDTGSEDTGTEPAGPLTMEVGDVADMTTNEDGSVSAEVTEEGRYVVILTSTAIRAGEIYGYGASADASARVLPRDLRPVAPELPVVAVAPPPAAGVGDTRSFDVYDGTRNVTIEAVATAVTDGVVVWVDQTTENPIGDVSTETIDAVLSNFETIVMPRERQVFGEESDVDGNARVDVLLSYTVNQYGAVAYVTGCDIGAADCSGNGSEIIYMGYPDPEDRYASANGITETFAHEINHLIYGWHKYALNDQPGARENIYLTEGMSALAQDLTGYNNGNQYVWAAAFDVSDYYRDRVYSCDGLSVNDFLRGADYYDAERDGVLRGGAYLFLRYLFEQAGGFEVEQDGAFTDVGGIDFLHRWFDAVELGPDAVRATTGREIEDLQLDWYTAMFVTGTVENDNPAWNFQDRVEDPITGYAFGVDPYANINGHMQLDGVLVQPLDEADGELRSGGVEYLRVNLDPGDTITVPVSVDAKAKARLVRIR
jgi:hypothetical protein